jgi:thiamine pyridinylase
MRLLFLSLILLALGLGVAEICWKTTARATPLTAHAAGSQGSPSSPVAASRKLRVVLYPYIPDFPAFRDAVKARFASEHPDVQLEVVDLTNNYYSPFSTDFIGSTKADVYEVDSVFLHDFVVNNKIQVLPAAAAEPEGELLKNAVLGATFDGKRYGAPHWVCGNFLFFKASDTAINRVKRLRDLERLIGRTHPSDRGLLVDLKGKSTLGEFYLNAAYDRYETASRVAAHVASYDLTLETDLKRIMLLCDSGLCRKDEYHDSPFYAQRFASGHSRAFIGYSERLSIVLEQSAKCPQGDSCLSDRDIDVKELPLDDRGVHVMSWVDSFVVDRKCKDECLRDAADFIKFANSETLTLSELLPASGIPTYLLPARAGFYSNQALVDKAHLYPKLKTIIETAVVPSAPMLNEQVRNSGRVLDQRLGEH